LLEMTSSWLKDVSLDPKRKSLCLEDPSSLKLKELVSNKLILNSSILLPKWDTEDSNLPKKKLNISED
jgi:hypothetical protein